MLKQLGRIIRRKKIKIYAKYLNHCIARGYKHGVNLRKVSSYKSDFTMRKGDVYSFYFLNIKKGYYNLTLRHVEKLLYDNRKHLVINISVPSKKSCPKNAASIGLSCNKKMYFYAGGGKKEDNYYRRSHLLYFDTNIPWIKLEFYSPLRKDLDFLEVNMSRVEVEKASMLARVLEEKDYNFILYANINVNICDGSSVWYSSMMNILASIGKTLVILSENVKNDVIMGNVPENPNLAFVTPDMIGLKKIDIAHAAALIGLLDCVLPRLQMVFVRGMAESLALMQNRKFFYRIAPYLTNIYEKINRNIFSTPEQVRAINLIAANATVFLTQTTEIQKYLESVAGGELENFILPPPINDTLALDINSAVGEPVKIGYAGKITPQWGIIQLLEWTKKLRSEGRDVRLVIIANKISLPVTNGQKFAEYLERELHKPWVEHINGLPRAEAMRKMSEMDFIWCYRPAGLEEGTLELSTKLVEMLAYGARCLCYPNEINTRLTGVNYPWHIKNYKDFKKAISIQKFDCREISKKIFENHSMSRICARMKDKFAPKKLEGPVISFNGHDFKFIDPYISSLKAHGHAVYEDNWEWSKTNDPAWCESCYVKSDIIFCEWGLENAVWYSKRNTDGKRLIIRVHRQEIGDKAKKYTSKINLEGVSKIIFVSEWVRDEAMKIYGWPEDLTAVIPNFVLDDHFKISFDKFKYDEIHLGMLGIVPCMKRLDRGLELLRLLLHDNKNAWLHIKGHRPENLPFMREPGRIKELKYYEEIYKEIEGSDELRERVIFEPYGNDVAAWYKNIDFILSPSDFESFHYSLADGVLSGAYPVIWSREGAAETFTKHWLVEDTEEAARKIINFMEYKDKKDIQLENRKLIVEKYGKDMIFAKLNDVLF